MMRKSQITITLLILFVVVIAVFRFFKNDNLDTSSFNSEQKIDYQLPDTSNTPKLITPYYNINHSIVADYILTTSGSDMTSAIQNALNKCSSNGGGTVWLERGIYYVSSSITIPSMCTLMGDYQDPDNYQGNLDYGTKIVVDVNNFKIDNNDLENTGLFKMNASSGIEGLTIYYKNQSLNSPKAQPWSIFYMVDMLFNIRNITLINSYLGIGRSTKMTPHEMLMIENVKGTILKKGLGIYNSSDVGSVNGLTFSPKYWAKANLKAFGDNTSNNSESTIASKVKALGGIGMELTDVDQEHYVNVSLSGFKFGIYIPDGNKVNPRSTGSGLMYNLNITDCNIAIQVDDCTLMDSNHGYIITNSVIAGSEYAIYTAASRSSKMGTIKLNDVAVKGKVDGIGKVIYNSQGDSYIDVPRGIDLTGRINNTGKFASLNYYRDKNVNSTNFAYLSASSSVDTINSKLASLSSSGGGVLYLKAGIYNIDKSVIIPSNVELRGSSMTATRIFKGGTVFKVNNNIGTETKAIKLVGSNLGITGINIIYEDNVKSLNISLSYTNNDYAIMANSSNNVFITNITIAGASRGILINNCKDFTVENVTTGVMENAYTVNNSRDGIIMNTLQNGTVIGRNDLVDYNKYNSIFSYVFPNTLEKLTQIAINESSDFELMNIFAYGIQKTLSINNSSWIYGANFGLDSTKMGTFLQNTNSSILLLNTVRVGNINISGSSNAGLYNTAIPGSVMEKDFSNSIFKLAKKYISPTLKVDSLVLFNNLSNKEISYQYDGDGGVSCKSSNEEFVKCSVSNKKIVIKPVKNTNSTVSITVSASSGLHYSSVSSVINVIINISSTLTNGDINGDNKITTQDYILLKRHIIGTKLSGDQLKRADVNNDGKINSLDYITIRKTIISGVSNVSSQAKTCPAYYTGLATACYDTTVPTISVWSNTSLKDTTINASRAITTICNLGNDHGDGLKTIEYYTDCANIKTANISNNCATISIDKCPNGALYYRLKDNYNYSSLNSVNNIGKYLLFGQVYNRFLNVNQPASNNETNIGYYVSNCTSTKACIKLIGEAAINERKNASNTEYVNYLYNSILGHQSDTGGLNFWVNSLNNQTPRINVLDNFINSNEAKEIYSSWGYN